MQTLSRRNLLTAGAALAVAPLAAKAAPRRAASPAVHFDAVGDVVLDSVNTGDVPGAVSAIWQDGAVQCVHRAGTRDITTHAPIGMDTLMGIASMSKPVTVAAALTLVEQGVMKLEDPITRWAPEFAHMRVLKRPDGPLDDSYPAPRLITIEDLMTHRAGFAYGFYTRGPLAIALIQKLGMGIESTMTADQWLQAIAALPLAYAPGERFNYGHAIDVLGFIVARAAGGDLRDVMRERLFAPLGMEDTDFWVPPEKRARFAQVYFSPKAGEFTPITINAFTGEKPMAYASGGQGLVSTPADYLKFVRMLLGEGRVDGARVLRAETVRRMCADHMTPEQRRFPAFGDARYWERWGCGLGMTVVRDPALLSDGAGKGAFGWGGAFGGWWQGDPTRDAVLLWMVQCLPAPPVPGAPVSVRDIPGAKGMAEFQRRAYAALDAR